MIDSRLRKYVQFFFDFLASVFQKLGVSANQLTVGAFIFGILAAVSLLFHFYILSLILLWVSGLLDVLDGSLARLDGSSSAWGAYMDMVFDRLVEVFFVIAFALAHKEASFAVMVFLGSVIFNFTSFMLAGSLFKNEGEKSMHYDSGLAERGETFLTFSLMLLFPAYAQIFLWLFNGLIIWTGCLRFLKIYRFCQS